MTLGLAYSHSRLQAGACPFRFHKLYVEKRSEPATIPAMVGRLKHDIMAKYLLCLYQAKKDLSMETLRNVARGVVLGMDLPPELSDSQTRQEITDSIKKMVDDLNMVWGGWCLDGIVGVDKHWVESKLTFGPGWKSLPEKAWFKTEGVYFRAILDWAYLKGRELTIVDHKSGWSDPDEDQLKRYAWCALKGYGLAPGDVDYVRVKFNMLAQQGTVKEVTFFTPDEIMCFGDDIDKAVLALETRTDWSEAVPGAACSYCGFKDECPAMTKAWNKAISPKGDSLAITTREDAEKGLVLYTLVKDRLSVLEKELQKFVIANGPVTAGGKTMEQRDTKTWALGKGKDVWGLIGALGKLGIPPVDILANIGFSETSLKRILKAGNAVKKQDLTRHLGDLKERFGKTTEGKGDPRIYVAKKK